MTQKLIIETKPNYYALAERLGYDEEEINEAHVLHEQGNETEREVFEAGERFKINGDESEAYIILDGYIYIYPTLSFRIQFIC